jgi:membrane protease subunit HflC
MKQNALKLVIGAILLVIFVLLVFVFQVRRSEVAVVTTFGKPTRDAGPGAHWKWPWPVQKVHKFDQRLHSFESPFEQVLTADGYNLLLAVYVGWRIHDPKVFFPLFGDSTREAEKSLEGLLRNAYSGVVGKHPFAHFISTDEKELQFAAIEQEMLARIQADAQANNYGLEVAFLGIKKLGLPESVTEAVFERMRSERQVQVSKIQFEGERQASEIKYAANLESATMLAEADAEALRTRSQGDSAAASSFEAFKQDPELANFILRLQALEAFLKEKATLVLDTQTSPLELLKGPPNPANSGAAAGPGQPAASAPKTTKAGKP